MKGSASKNDLLSSDMILASGSMVVRSKPKNKGKDLRMT